MLIQTHCKILHNFNAATTSYLLHRNLLSANKSFVSEKRVKKKSQLFLNYKCNFNCSCFNFCTVHSQEVLVWPWGSFSRVQLTSVDFIMGNNFSLLWQINNIRRLLFNWPQFPPTNSKQTVKKKKKVIYFNIFLPLFEISYTLFLYHYSSLAGKNVYIFLLKNGFWWLRKWIRIMCFTSTGYGEVPNSFLKYRNLCNH